MTIANGSIFPRNGVPAGQAAPGADDDARATCDDLWYKASCNPRFDPQAMNSIMAELVNAVNGHCEGGTGPEWDCSIQTNLLLAICRHFNEKLFGCLDREFPTIGQECEIEQLVLATDANGCQRIARYTEEASRLGCAGHCTAWPDGTAQFQVPADPLNFASYYNAQDLYADEQAGTIDFAKLDSTKLWRMEINVPCDGTVITLDGDNGIFFNPTGTNGRGQFAIRIDGVFDSNDALQRVREAYGVGTNYLATLPYNPEPIVLDAGPHVIESYWIGFRENEPAAQANVVCQPGAAVGGTTCARIAVG